MTLFFLSFIFTFLSSASNDIYGFESIQVRCNAGKHRVGVKFTRQSGGSIAVAGNAVIHGEKAKCWVRRESLIQGRIWQGQLHAVCKRDRLLPGDIIEVDVYYNRKGKTSGSTKVRLEKFGINNDEILTSSCSFTVKVKKLNP